MTENKTQAETEAFAKHLKFKAKSPVTIKNYIFQLQHYLTYLNSHDLLSKKPTEQNIQSYVEAREDENEKEYSIHTKNLLYATLRLYYKWKGNHDFAEKLENFKDTQKKIPITMTIEQVRATVKEAGKLHNNKPTLNERNELIIEFLYMTACRINELATLTIDKIDFKKGQAKVMGKRGERIVNLSPLWLEKFKQYFKIRNDGLSKESREQRKLFLNFAGAEITKRGLQYIIERSCRNAEVYSNYEKRIPMSAHRFRASCATHLLESGEGEIKVAEYLGHSSMEMVRKYAGAGAITTRNLKTWEALEKKNGGTKNEKR